MYGLAAIGVNGRQMQELERERGREREQRRMYRCLLGLPRRVAMEVLGEEIGSSSFKDRLGKARISLIRRCWTEIKD